MESGFTDTFQIFVSTHIFCVLRLMKTYYGYILTFYVLYVGSTRKIDL